MAASFSVQGVTLYAPDLSVPVPFVRTPPNPDFRGLPRHTYETEPGTYSEFRAMQQKSASVYPAALADGSDVIVRIVSKCAPLSAQLQILRYLSQAERSADSRNHLVPIFQELLFRDWVFIVMPRFSPSPIDDSCHMCARWFTTMGEILDFILQILEGFDFLHEHLIAHQDIASPNIVMNHVGERTFGYLNRFPRRYFLIDFELAIQFERNSEPADRVAVGPPSEGLNPLRLAPEIGTNAHCPFRADVWQLGLLLFRSFPTQVEQVTNLARSMLSRQPASRPRMHDAHNTIQHLRRITPQEVLSSEVRRNTVFDVVEDEDFPPYLKAFLDGDPVRFEN